MHPEAYAYVARTLKTLPPLTSVVEFGARNINGSVRPLFKDAKRYIGIDCAPGDGVDVVTGATMYRPRFKPTCVVATEVLEHTDLGAEIIANAYRILAPGGVLILTAAGEGRAPHSAVDGCALREFEHYGNITQRDLTEWVTGAGFVDGTIEYDPDAHDIRCVAVKPHA